jgi:hypothetical protein
MSEGRTSLTVEELEAESRKLKRLIDEAQRIDCEITEYLHRLREIGRPSPPNQRRLRLPVRF